MNALLRRLYLVFLSNSLWNSVQCSLCEDMSPSLIPHYGRSTSNISSKAALRTNSRSIVAMDIRRRKDWTKYRKCNLTSFYKIKKQLLVFEILSISLYKTNGSIVDWGPCGVGTFIFATVVHLRIHFIMYAFQLLRSYRLLYIFTKIVTDEGSLPTHATTTWWQGSLL